MATVPKIKAFLSTQKEILDADGQNKEVGLESLYEALLRLELLQRGVLLDDTTDALAAISNSAGKAILDADSTAYPKPLLAGSAVIAGRMAETLATRIATDTNETRLLVNASFNETLRRCRDVKDARLTALIELLSNPVSSTSFWIVAEGFYLRAASFSPDAPPMWKKAWDACAMVNSKPHQRPQLNSYECVTAISHLIRIAKSKDNTKREAELQLRMADCFLDSVNADESNNCSATNATQKEILLKVFCSGYRPIGLTAPKDQTIGKANRALQFDTVVLSDDDSVYHKLLLLQALLSEEDVSVESEALGEFEKAKNRAADTTSKKKVGVPLSEPLSLKTYVSKSRSKILKETCQKKEENMLWHASAIRDKLTTFVPSSFRLKTSCALLIRYIDRLQLKAKAATSADKEACWMRILEFTKPFIQSWPAVLTKLANSGDELVHSEAIINALDDRDTSELELMERTSTIFSHVTWMMCDSIPEDITTADFFQPTQTMLSNLLTRREKARTFLTSQTKSVGTATDSPEEEIRLQLLHALTAIKSFLVLRHSKGSAEADSPQTKDVSDLATSRSNIHVEHGGEFGFSFFDFVVSWAGLHTSPWPYCTQPEARRLVEAAKSDLEEARSTWGREISSTEQCILNLGKADAEGASFVGGNLSAAYNILTQTLKESENLCKKSLANFLSAGIYYRLSELVMREGPQSDCHDSPITLAQQSLQKYNSADFDNESSSRYVWRLDSFFTASLSFQISRTRQHIATVLLQSGEADRAKSFLEDAVRDAPLDAIAAFSLGSFQLHACFLNGVCSSETLKATQMQLLRAAKMDSSEASPFALLGYIFEYTKDTKRAIGCYSKALVLEPSHPVAGRGVIRIAPSESLSKIFSSAIATPSASVGWVWRAIAQKKSLDAGDDELAVVSLLKALRCRDVERPELESLSAFFVSPLHARKAGQGELACVLADLGACYRRLGRFTASLRSYHAAIEASPVISESYLCACAQVEMDLGLYDEAQEKYQKSLKSSGNDIIETHHLASYGQSVALMGSALRDNQDGKAWSAFDKIQQAIEICESISQGKYICLHKLIGDLYSFGASLPSRVFADDHTYDTEESSSRTSMQSQINFISRGDIAYRHAESLLSGESEDTQIVRASLVSDSGSNLLLQLQLQKAWDDRGLHQSIHISDANTLAEKARDRFRLALNLYPLYSPAWCGLGCASAGTDLLLSQHAFCRAIQLDNTSPDPYANLSFLYTSQNRFSSSARVSDALTEVADTPMLWINRAMILEIEARQHPGEHSSNEKKSQASDAYRAAQQVTKHQSAILGLAMTCRASYGLSKQDFQASNQESRCNMSMYMSMIGGVDCTANIILGLLDIEAGAQNGSEQRISDGLDELRNGLAVLKNDRRGVSQQKALDWKLLENIDVENENHTRAKEGHEEIYALNRQIVHQPNRGDLWLEFAKKLALEPNMTSSAIVAARRASSILLQQLRKTDSVSYSSYTLSVNADDISDALSLQYSLECVSSQKESGVPNPGYLQRSLLINPANTLAREALTKV